MKDEEGGVRSRSPIPRLLGQNTAETLLARAIERDTVAHAYLFLGPSGCGKTTAARLFAQATNCERQPAVLKDEGGRMNDEGQAEAGQPSSLIPLPSGTLRLNPCGECESCRRIRAETHPEVIVIRPGSKTGQNIAIDQVRDIRRNAALAAKMGRRRVYIFPNFETISEPAANALLKTLEEPSPHVVLLLCAANPSQVLPTIRSRCQVVRVNLCDPALIRDHLTGGGTTPQIADELARASGGRAGVAINWASAPSVLKSRRAVLDVFEHAVEAQVKARRDPSIGVLALRLAEELRGLVSAPEPDGDTPPRPVKMFHSDNLDIGMGYLRDLMVLANGASPELVQNQDRLPALQELAAAVVPGRVVEDIRTIREAQEMLEQNVGVQIALERMFWAIITEPVPLPVGLFEEVAA